MTILDRIVEARLELVALVNAATIAVASFGFDVSEAQQAAITGVVNAVLIVGYRLVKGTPSVASSTSRTG